MWHRGEAPAQHGAELVHCRRRKLEDGVEAAPNRGLERGLMVGRRNEQAGTSVGIEHLEHGGRPFA